MKLLSWIGFILLGLIMAGCKSDEAAKSAAPKSVAARVVESKLEQTPLLASATGTLKAHESATLSAQLMGRVRQVLVRAGDVVKAGQTLIVLDDATLNSSLEQAAAAVKAAEQQLAAAQAQANLAASTLTRYQQLQAQKSVSPQEMDEVTRRAQAAQAQVEALKAQSAAMRAQHSGASAMLGYSRIAAPFAGVITARLADPGAMAAPGVPLMQINSAGPLELETAVDESVLAAVRKGMKVDVQIDASTGAHAGTVTEILPAADPMSHSFVVKIALSSGKDLHAGMYASTSFVTGTKQAILVARSAIVTRGSLHCAYVLDADSLAQLRTLTLGATHGDRVEVLSGLSAGEKLVDSPADRDLAGARIEVQP